ncbi:hypothetical protein QEH59_06420 [Coraliomargarita sp. SDUM461004]|uniref:Uncharacterized protein n=1 Tax=Thalassobacterium sedimentorum TaxID=3041258 RepID=A0ABU1AJL5_9BACT|nr:hypothetical protein [Coraliomargarita sp. SDUM461004]MDQ8194050.1 hypothetical protein [Coraliomargarita sp. SDUM461004]
MINYVGQKQNNFLRWLISYPQSSSSDLEQLDLPSSDFSEDQVTLVNSGTLGTSSANNPQNIIRAPLVEIDTSAAERYAWVVMDEGVKANISLPALVDTSGWGSEPIQSISKYGSPSSSGISNISALSAFGPSEENNSLTRITSHASGSLAFNEAGGDLDVYKGLFHELTTHSQSVLSDVVNGGLKKDLSLLSEYTNLSASSFTPRFLYSQGNSQSYASEPSWSYLLDYMSSYRSPILSLNGDDVPRINSAVSDWTLDTNQMLSPRQSYAPTPAITRIQMVFSLIAMRTGNNNRESAIQNLSGDTYEKGKFRVLFLIASPVVTLYNPYNVPLDTKNLYLSMSGIPIGFTFKRADHSNYANVVPLSNRPVPFDAFTLNPNNSPRIQSEGVEFVFSISASDDSDDDFTLAPGETIVISPFADDSNTSAGNLSNWKSDKQSDYNLMRGQPGYIEGAGLIYDYLVPSNNNPHANYDYENQTDTITLTTEDGTLSLSNAQPNIGNGGTDLIAILPHDEMQVDVDFAQPHFPESADNIPFKIELYDAHPFADSVTVNRLGSYTFDYGDDINILRTAAEKFTTDTFPINQNLVWGSDIFPRSGNLGNYTVSQLVTTPIAVLDIFAQTTLSNNTPALPWAFSNPTTLAGINKFDNLSTFNQSYQITLRAPTIPSVEIDSENHGFSFTGISSLEGTKFGTHFEQPLQPLQSLASLQHANLASSGYLPKVDYVVGNSRTNPLISTESTVTFNTDLNYDLVDHSYLSNYTLWDSYYLSTLATYRSVIAPSGPTLASNLDNFLSGSPLINPNIRLNTQTYDNSTIRSELMDESDSLRPDAYQKLSTYQYVDGGFNVNSTSVSAWKALLTSVSSQSIDSPPLVQEINDADYDISYTTANRYTYSRYRVTNHNNSFDADATNTAPSTTRSSPAAHAAWQGYRDLTEAQVDALAQNIVNEVKARGPFLSLSEFINRKLGSDASDMRNKMGAIESAITQTDINDTLKADMGVDIDISSLSLPNLSYTTENTATGIPGFLSQADILQQIGQKISARSDTFRIRVYGDTVNPLTGETYRAYCEAIVQRTPDYVDPNLEPWDPPSPNDLGRRFTIQSLRWLNEDDI